MVCLKELVLTFRSCATGTHEPCQVWKEAAVSGHSCVPWGYLNRAMNLSNAWDCFIDYGCAALWIKLVMKPYWIHVNLIRFFAFLKILYNGYNIEKQHGSIEASDDDGAYTIRLTFPR